MRKEYETPKAEKMDFNYSEAVVASSTFCRWEIPMGNVGSKSCRQDEMGPGHATNELND